MSTKEKVFFPNLDGFRFFAFLLVFLQHGFGKTIKTLGIEENTDNKLFRPFIAGEAGVSFFFVLSGFLITYLILTEIKLNGNVDIISFYIRRALRIFPLYFLVIIWDVVIYSQLKLLFGFPGYVEYGNPFLYFLFLGNFDVINLNQSGIMGAMSTNITWSVAIEEQFYLGWVILFYFLRPKFYKYLFLFVIIGSMFFRILNSGDGSVLYFHTFSVISDMAVGGGCAYLIMNFQNFKDFFINLKKYTIIFIYIIGILAFWLEHQIFPPWLTRFPLTVFYIFIILEQNYSSNSIFKMGNYKIISSLGKYTYGLYLLHPIALLLIDIVSRLLKISTDTFFKSLLQGVVVFFLSILLSYCSYHFFEKRFLELKKKFSYFQSGN
jgi:peptidoglycan/LPS O-acetylase OafA/YrhL